MIKIKLASVLLLSSVCFFSCKTNTNETKEEVNQNEIKTDTVKTTTIENKTNSLIAPPDKDYTGDYIDKYPNGVIKFTGFFRFGLRHGQWLSFYDNGIKWSECYYDKGKREGQSTVYFPNGNVQYTGWYKQDLQDSLWFYYDINKIELDKRAYRMGVETGLVN
jgi:antitoxin component YwqK of YwqJK toxin-antitoxin module